MLLVVALSSGCTHVRQTSDLSFQPVVERPAYTGGHGPRVLIDESHCNLHTAAVKVH